MEKNKRHITLYTPAKIYNGHIDIASETLRTIDIFNSANIFWKDPAEKSFNDALLVNDATVMMSGNMKLGDFPRLQVRLAEIIFFHDSLENVSDSKEKLRAASLMRKTRETQSQVNIITRTRGDGFFYISGIFHGLFKSKSNNRYIPLTRVNVIEAFRSGDRWQKRTIPVEGGFIGISTLHIEACTFSEIRKAD